MYYGKNVNLSEYTKEDLPLVVDLLNDWEIQCKINSGLISPFTLDDELEWFEQNRKNKEEFHSFAIRKIQDKTYIGGCGYHNVNYKNRTCQVGIVINQKKFQNQGFGTEAFQLLINYLFKEMNIRKILLNVFANNSRAIHVYKKIGFIVEGTLKNNIYREGHYWDELIMAKFSE